HGLPDGTHTVTVEAGDRSDKPERTNWASASATFKSDNTPPPSPENAALSRGDGWRDRPGFLVTWTNSSDGAPDKASGVSGAVYRPCQAGSGQCVTGQSPPSLNGRPPTSLAVAVPSQGDWVLQLYLADAVGNANLNSARTLHLRYDSEPPRSVVF